MLNAAGKKLRSFVWRHNTPRLTQNQILKAVLNSNSKLVRLELQLHDNRMNNMAQYDYHHLAQCCKRLEVLSLNDESAVNVSDVINASRDTLHSITLHRMYRLRENPLKQALMSCQLDSLNLDQCYQMSDLCDVLEHHQTSLVKLHLANTQPNQTTMGAILTIRGLTTLDISCNQRVNSSFVRMLSNCLRNLQWLSLSHCNIDDEAVSCIARLSLRHLNLAHTPITSDALSHLHSPLASLDLSSCTGITSAVESVNRLLTRTPTIGAIRLGGFERLVVDVAESFLIDVTY